MGNAKIFYKLLITLGAAFSIVNCSAVNFDKNPEKTEASTSAQGGGGGQAPGGDASGTLTQNGGDVSNSGDATGVITGTGNASAAVLPKLIFIGPPCLRLTNCLVTFQLDKVYPSTTEFDWKTNDTLFGTASLAGEPPWGKPGYPGDAAAQYVPTSGHVVIPAGQIQASVYVRNINQQDVPISIGVLMSNCAYQSLYESCQKFFSN